MSVGARTVTLTDFLLARIAEDEGVARASGPDGGDWSSRYDDMPDCHMYGSFGWTVSGPGVETEDSEWGKSVADHIALHDPARVLAECEAKRRIIEECQGAAEWTASPDCDAPLTYSTMAGVLLGALRHLAAVYADHPDFRDEWRP